MREPSKDYSVKCMKTNSKYIYGLISGIVKCIKYSLLIIKSCYKKIHKSL